jgi:transposase-like protein
MSAAQKLKREAAMLALLAGKNHKQAAEAAGVDVRTLHRWRHKPEFAAELDRHRRIRFSRALT